DRGHLVRHRTDSLRRACRENTDQARRPVSTAVATALRAVFLCENDTDAESATGPRTGRIRPSANRWLQHLSNRFHLCVCSLDITQQKNDLRAGRLQHSPCVDGARPPSACERVLRHAIEMFSPCYGDKLVDFEFLTRRHHRGALGETLCEFRIVIQPPERIPGKHYVCGAAASQLFKIYNRVLAIARSTLVNAVVFQKMPALALRIIKYRWVAHVGGND